MLNFKFFRALRRNPQLDEISPTVPITLAKNNNSVWRIQQIFVERLATLVVNCLCHFLLPEGQADIATMSIQVITYTNKLFLKYRALVTSRFVKSFRDPLRTAWRNEFGSRPLG